MACVALYDMQTIQLKLLMHTVILYQLPEYIKCFSIKDLAVNGKDIISLGVKQGPEIGKWLNYALDEVINDRLENNKEDILNDIDAKLYAEREEGNNEEMS